MLSDKSGSKVACLVKPGGSMTRDQTAREDAERVCGLYGSLDHFINQIAYEVVVMCLGDPHYAHLTLREG